MIQEIGCLTVIGDVKLGINAYKIEDDLRLCSRKLGQEINNNGQECMFSKISLLLFYFQGI